MFTASGATVDGAAYERVVSDMAAFVGVYTVGEMLSAPALSALSVAIPPAELRGRYQAVFQTSWAVGGAIGPALFTALLSADAAYPWLLLLVLSALLIPASRSLQGRLQLAGT